jgi:hypothetical protein
LPSTSFYIPLAKTLIFAMGRNVENEFIEQGTCEGEQVNLAA